MKLDKLETHDRLLFFKKQQEDMSRGIQDCIKNVPVSITSPFYVLGHSRKVDVDEQVDLLYRGSLIVPHERMIWSPRITKPLAEANSYLFLCHKYTDIVEIIWMLPKRELWSQYAPGKIMHNENVWISIQNFKKNRNEMNQPDKNGPKPKDEENWFMIMGEEALRNKSMKSENNLIARLYE